MNIEFDAEDVALFNKAFEIVIGHEGGYVNDPADAGGETKYGISKRSYPRLNIKELTLENARHIYYHDWWAKYGIGEIENDEMAIKFFEFAINAGFGKASEVLQWALLAVGKKVKVDGYAGAKTYAAVNQVDNAEALLAAFRAEQSNHYRTLIKAKPSQKRFELGWLRRAYGWDVKGFV